MSRSIQSLPISTVNLISSGQIVTSVSSVVKELVENALDAEAEAIEVKLEGAGLDRIEVKDDGVGVVKENIPSMVLDHCTSKISEFDDLQSLRSYGFRGEAVHAISNVSKLEISSKPKEQKIGHKFVFDSSGSVVSNSSVAMISGTIVVAKDLFHNLPVRKNLYRKGSWKKDDLKKVENLCRAFAIINPKLRISLSLDRNLIFQKSASSDLARSIKSVLGPFCAEPLEIKMAESGGQIFIPEFLASNSKSSPENTFLFVNRRPVEWKELSRILKRTSKEVLKGKEVYPMSVIALNIPPGELDQNLDPNKYSIMLRQKEELLELIENKLKVFYCINEKMKEGENVCLESSLIEKENFEKEKPANISLSPSFYLDGKKPLPREEEENETSFQIGTDLKEIYLGSNKPKSRQQQQQQQQPNNDIRPRQNHMRTFQSLESNLNRESNPSEIAVLSTKNTANPVDNFGDSPVIISRETPPESDYSGSPSIRQSTPIESDVIQNQEQMMMQQKEGTISKPLENLNKSLDFEPERGTKPEKAKVGNKAASEIPNKESLREPVKSMDSDSSMVSGNQMTLDSWSRGLALNCSPVQIVRGNQAVQKRGQEEAEEILEDSVPKKKQRPEIKKPRNNDSKNSNENEQKIDVFMKKLESRKTEVGNRTLKSMAAPNGTPRIANNFRKIKMFRKVSVVKCEISKMQHQSNKAEMLDGRVKIVGCLAKAPFWIVLLKQELLLLQHQRLEEVSLFKRLMKHQELPTSVLKNPLDLTKNASWNPKFRSLLEGFLHRTNDESNSGFVKDERLEKNGQSLKIQGDSVFHTGSCTSIINYIGPHEVMEILEKLLENPDLSISESRPMRIKAFLISEAVRMTRENPPGIDREKALNLVMENLVQNETKLCLHSKPVTHKLFSLC